TSGGTACCEPYWSRAPAWTTATSPPTPCSPPHEPTASSTWPEKSAFRGRRCGPSWRTTSPESWPPDRCRSRPLRSDRGWGGSLRLPRSRARRPARQGGGSSGHRGLVRPGERVPGIARAVQPYEAQEFTDDARGAHRPAGARFEAARGGPVLDVGPAGAVGVPDRAGGQVRDEDLGEVVRVPLFGDPVAGQGEDARGAAAAAVVVPEAGAQPPGQAGVG